MNHETSTGWCARHMGCQRRECVERGRRYNTLNRNLRRMGVSGYVPVGTLRQKVEDDLKKGYSRSQLAKIYGIDIETLAVILSGAREHAYRITAQRIMGADLPLGNSGKVPALATRRMLRALIADGHDHDELRTWLLEHGCFVGPVWVHRVTGNDRAVGSVMAGSARAVNAMWEALCMHPGPSDHARELGEKRGWPRPLAWDEDTIDNLEAKPATRSS